MKFKRVLLKLSGEQFAGSRDHGVDAEYLASIAKELKELSQQNLQIGIVVGGGNFMRGAAIAGHGIERATGDYMGMLATVINGLAMVDTLEAVGQPARLQSRLRVDNVAEPYIRRRAIRHMEKGRIIIIAGGTGNPYVTTDTAAVSAALELECEVVLKATNVDGVYDKDPNKYAGAKLHKKLSYAEALRNPDIKVMDKTAMALAMEHQLPIVVFELASGNLKKVVNQTSFGSTVTI